MSDLFEAPEVTDNGVNRDRFGRPILPPATESGAPRPWTRVTTLARTLSDEYNLNEWRNRQVAYGIGLRPDLLALAQSATSGDDRQVLTDVAQQAMDAAKARAGANTGTARHAFSARVDGGAPLESIPDADRPYLAAYQDGMTAANLTPIPGMFERMCICEEVACCGTFDRALAGYGGHPYTIGDLKTAKLDSLQYAYLEIAIQLAVYARATHLWDPVARTWRPKPATNLEHAIVMHLPNDVPPERARLDLYDIDIVSGWDAALLAVKVRAARSAPKRYARPLPRVEKVAEVLAGPLVAAAGVAASAYADELRSATTMAELSAVWRRASARGEWTGALEAIGRQRASELKTGVSPA